MEGFGSGSGTSIIRRKNAERVLSVPRDAYHQAEPADTHAVFLRLCASALSDLKPPRPAQRGEVAERREAGEGLPRFTDEGSGPPGGGTVVKTPKIAAHSNRSVL
jgi:hypothetical protein